MKTPVLVASALATAITLVGCGGTAQSVSTEKCYGVAAAGKNDCAGEAHNCAGQAMAAGSPGDFINVPRGVCDKLAGGSEGGEAS